MPLCLALGDPTDWPASAVSPDRASGYVTIQTDTRRQLDARTAGVYLRAEPEDMGVLHGRYDRRRVAFIAERLRQCKSIAKS